MSAALKTAAVQHALDVAQIYKDNATLARGLPQALPRLRIADEPEAPPPEPIKGDPGEPGAPGKDADESAILKAILDKLQPSTSTTTINNPQPNRLLPWMLALLGTGLGAGGLTYYLNRPDVIINEIGDDPLLPHLMEKGYHLPPDKRVTE